TFLFGGVGTITPSGALTAFDLPFHDGGNNDPRPFSITTGPDGNLWLAERLGDRIARITTSGVVTEFPVPTPGCNPMGITPGPDGAMWFTCFGNGRIGRMTTAGDAVDHALPSGASEPLGIVSGPRGELWFVEYGASKIGSIVP